jgi:uncharacterized membrane protein
MPSSQVQTALERWRDAGLIDDATTRRILDYEQKAAPDRERRFPLAQALAITFGVLLVGAGILLFIAAHWEQLSPMQRFSLVMTTLGGLHVVAALLRERSEKLSRGLHAMGTITLGASIALAGQIFNLNEHWPGGILLWALGAWLAYFVLDDWIQAALAAILTPAWLYSEWDLATDRMSGGDHVTSVGVALLAIVYLTAQARDDRNPLRRALRWIGGLGLFPAVLWTMFVRNELRWHGQAASQVPAGLATFGWAVAIGAPLAVAYALRRNQAWAAVIAAGWVFVSSIVPAPWSRYEGSSDWGFLMHGLSSFLWTGLGSVLLIAWGLYDQRRERVNLGVAGFALSLIAFYFSSIFDKLGRSWSLITLGALFLGGGYLMERTRRRLISRLEGSPA